MRASVVLPVPGGPKRIIEPTRSSAIALPQRRVGPEHLLLAHELLQRARAQPVGERRQARQPLFRRVREEIGHVPKYAVWSGPVGDTLSEGGAEMRRCYALLATALVFGLAVAVSSAGSTPPGATARCRDGTYSYSKHHQGTCSHHGGVAKWLDGSSSSSGSSSSGGSGQTIDVGRTVLLEPRTKSSDCRLGANPDRRCSPGAYYSKLTEAVICSSSFHTGEVRDVPQSEKYAVEEEYGMAPRLYGRTLEIDHIVSLELGGSNEIANLYPEKADANPGYHVKDVLENRLHALVCSSQMSLRSAQIGIASNWQALYRKVFGTAPSG